ncbi:MAG: hypothetical protein ABIN57_07200 [Chitinophagaceae bacterium]
MQIKQTLVRLLLVLLPVAASAQTTYLPQDAREIYLLNRLEIKAVHDSVLNFSKLKPFSRESLIPLLEKYSSLALPITTQNGTELNAQINEVKPRLTKVDDYNIYSALLDNPEWSTVHAQSKRPFLKNFYKSPANFYEVNKPEFFLAVNPVFQYTLSKEKGNTENLFLNTRGISLRGRIGNKIGFATYLTDNQERDPLYVQQYATERKAVPGQGFYQDFKGNGYDYFDTRGYLTFSASKYIDLTFGYDKNFIGNGYRSLFLSDFGSPALFFRINTRIWKFNYQNLFMELVSGNRLGADNLYPKKYAAMHHLDLAVTKWMNIGLFEGVIFGRKNRFEFGYFNPVIFYRSVEQQSGSFDNSVLGADLKANVAGHFQVYGQFLLDEFNLKEQRKGTGWWGNKYGIQMGAKYIDALSIKNLDLQLEMNRVRPFTYSHRDSVANYTHYNQPLAHPLGANFNEVIGIARYQPAPKWVMQAKAMYVLQGRDTGVVNNGANIFLPNGPPYRVKDFGFSIGEGVRTKTGLLSFLLSYELKHNFYLEAYALYRKQTADVKSLSSNTTLFSAGVRWNLQRREFDF